jgi:hypothetical protein
MKKITTFLVALTGAVSLLSLSSCKKILDEIKHHPNGTADNCRIDKIYSLTQIVDDTGTPSDLNDTVSFIYDLKGNPVAVNYKSSPYTIDSYGRNKIFTYDAQNRLYLFLDNITTFQDELSSYKHALNWHKFTYPNATQVVDSIFTYTEGDISTNSRPEYFSGSEVQKYTLDSYGRIISWSDQYGHSANYSYNSNGNLILTGVTYTNKTSIYQTHKTWMFLARDYSVNIADGIATQFNSNKLPVKFNNNKLPLFFYDFDKNITVMYQCK